MKFCRVKKSTLIGFLVVVILAMAGLSVAVVYAWFYLGDKDELEFDAAPFELGVDYEVDTDVVNSNFMNFMPGNSVFYDIRVLNFPESAKELLITLTVPVGAVIPAEMEYTLANKTGTMCDMFVFSVGRLKGFTNAPEDLPNRVPIGPRIGTNGNATLVSLDLPATFPTEGGLSFRLTITYEPHETLGLLHINKLVTLKIAGTNYSFAYQDLLARVNQLKTFQNV